MAGFAYSEDSQYVKQILEPTGGNIDRPKDWYYLEAHNDNSWLWIISREEVIEKPYDVGVRIQAVPRIQEITGKTPKQFILDFKAQKKSEADKVINECSATNDGLFSRVCLETEEGKYRILYSLFWGNGTDVVVVSISGAPKDEWATYQETFNHMTRFELIDVSRFVGQ
ncbi:hypothetical protein ACFL2V_12070 [Pseudomonadota bacterium]